MSAYDVGVESACSNEIRKATRRSCPKVSTHCRLRPTATRSVREGFGRRARSKSYVEQSCFDYSVARLRWYSSCSYVVTDAEGAGQTDQSLNACGGANQWHYGDGYGTFDDGKKPPLPCCSTLTRGNCFRSPAIQHPPTASGCFAVHLPCRGARYRSSWKFVAFLSGKSAVPSNPLPPQLGPQHRRRLRVIRF